MEITLEKVLKKKDVILLDVSSTSSSDFYWYLGQVKKITELDLRKVDLEISRISQFTNTLLAENSRTISPITEELSALMGIINSNNKYLFRNTSENGIEERKKLEELHQAIFYMVKCSKTKEISQTELGALNGNYERLFEIVCTLSEELGLKKDTSLKYSRHHAQDWKDKRTDESLVASAYSLMLQGKTCGILTGDTDLISLMGVCTRIIGGKAFLPQNKNFRKSVTRNNYGVYFRTKDQDCSDLLLNLYQERINLSITKFDESFLLYNQPNKAIESRISSLMKGIKYHE